MRLTDVEVESCVHGTMVIEPCFDADAINCVSVDVVSGEQIPVFQDYIAPYVDLSGLSGAVHTALECVMSDKMVISERGALLWYSGEMALALPDANAIWSSDAACLARTSHV
ncbi:hypothetical protein [Shewanella colwelliana]|uniref:hypothetical protein n=1 Tax=Shewanella colwelliana TaxID=23 RepID=UPI0022AE83AA|nr:hypothetical protein [Shewanella colwelliana]MCZ4336540.1 hypothetical protein [Shewanella colwelliana]